MLTIFNRKELITTMDMQRQSNIRSILSAKVPSRVMRKFVCRLWLNAVSQQ